MVMAPESLTFFSVPSWAAAARLNAAAAAKTRMRFMAGSPLVVPEKILPLVHAGRGGPYALGHRGEQRQAESRVGLHQVEEHRAVDAEQHAVGLGAGVRRARRLVD